MPYLIPILVAALTLAVAATSAVAVPADPGAGVAAVFPPWWARERAAAAVAQADGLIVREGAIPTIIVVRPSGPDLAERLRAQGAVLILNPLAARGCPGPARDRP